MLPQNVRTLFAEAVTHQRRRHQTERDKAIQEFTFKMARQGVSQSSAFNNGKVEIHCEAFKKYAAGIWGDMQRVLGGGFEVYPGCENDLINFLKESLAAVYDADTNNLFAFKNDVHTPTTRHLARCKPRFEFPCKVVTEKLTTEIKLFINRLRVIKQKEATLPSSENPEKLVQELTKAIVANTEQKGKAALDKANALASLNLKEALAKWYQFDPPAMKTDTKARIEKAAKMYLTDNQKQSLAKIAKEFGVSRKTVSKWFTSFAEYTGFKVVSHQSHESVADHLKAESSQENETSGDNENAD
jgi:biotin operon repressor